MVRSRKLLIIIPSPQTTLDTKHSIITLSQQVACIHEWAGSSSAIKYKQMRKGEERGRKGEEGRDKKPQKEKVRDGEIETRG